MQKEGPIDRDPETEKGREAGGKWTERTEDREREPGKARDGWREKARDADREGHRGSRSDSET